MCNGQSAISQGEEMKELTDTDGLNGDMNPILGVCRIMHYGQHCKCAVGNERFY